MANVLDRVHRKARIAVVVFLAAAALAAKSAATEPVDLKIMSFNVRFSRGVPQEPAAENDWNDENFPRRERAVRVIRDYMPDILGVQEARDLQIDDLREALPEFDFYGVGRDDGKTGGEFCAIFYRKERLTRTGEGSFWLSATPEKPGTSFYTAPGAVPRIASWVRLADEPSGKEIFVLNMHWDHISGPAWLKSAKLARERLEKLAAGLPAIVMGDLNTPEDSRPVRELLGIDGSTGRRVIDSYRKLHPQVSTDESTFNHWKGTTAGKRIDFILHTADFTPTAAAIVRTNHDGRWPSDHYPVTAALSFPVRFPPLDGEG